MSGKKPADEGHRERVARLTVDEAPSALPQMRPPPKGDRKQALRDAGARARKRAAKKR
jgi:hypothetical protein